VLAALNAAWTGLLHLADSILPKIMWVFIIAGVVLSCMHQSSLGSLMLIAPTKLHPLWYTPMLPLLFLTSAIAVGYPMVVFEATLATTSLKLDAEMKILTPADPYHHFSAGDLPGAESGRHGGPRHLCLPAGRHGPDQRLPHRGDLRACSFPG
jgi:vacuolar-type H+-ATPase subunit I/STV1